MRTLGDPEIKDIPSKVEIALRVLDKASFTNNAKIPETLINKASQVIEEYLTGSCFSER